MSSRAAKDFQSIDKRRTKRPKHLKSVTTSKYGKRASVPRCEALDS